MPKQIEELFRANIAGIYVDIVARNHSKPYIRMPATHLDFTTDQMRKLADFLISTANQIDNDPDFNPKQKS